ncbi:extracellular solute-binding protein, partial [bacterium]|nr:extracellular solute-binding protein [bacterium]
MLKNLDLQTILLFIFGIVLVAGVLVFSGAVSSPKEKQRQQLQNSKIVIWGTLPKEVFRGDILKFIIDELGTSNAVTYVERPIETFDNELVEKLAAGTGPDIILLPDSLIGRHAEKIELLPYESFTERQFLETFIQGSEIYLRPEGTLGLPFSIDPMVMYWNRNMFSTASVVRPPVYWDELLTLTPLLTKRDDANNIIKSAVSFGEYGNVTNAKEIISMLMIQTGNPITRNDIKNGKISATIGTAGENYPAGNDVLRFYTDFADPLKSVYSWNRSLADSKNAFLAQDLAIYFGFASEAAELQKKNPNLDFGVAPVPQIRDYEFRSVFVRMNAASVMKTSKSKPAAFRVALILSSAPALKIYTEQ